MFGLTTLGTVHTAIGIVALIAGALSFARSGFILPRTGLGRLYVWTTVATCLTGFGIFQHGGFGAPHLLGIVTLAVLAVAAADERWQFFGRASVYVQTVCYSLSYFFHWIPGITETFTRVPGGAPLFTGPDDPVLAKTIGVVFLVCVIGIALQLRALWGGGGPHTRSSTVAMP